MIKLSELLPDTILDSMNESIDAPAIVQSANNISSGLINYIKYVENNQREGFKNGKWYPHKSPEGGLPTIGYGHKLQKSEIDKLSNGISDSEVNKLLIHDLELARKKVYSDIKSMFNVTIPLDQRQEEMLIDYAFNLGTIKGFPTYVKAVLNKNWKIAAKECHRTYKDSHGKRHALSRDKIFFNRYLKGIL